MRILHAVHDYLPRYRAGTEIYVHQLARRQMANGHHVTVLCAEYDPGRAHGTVRTRCHDGIDVVEVTNNWDFASFEQTYRPASIEPAVREAIEYCGPDVLHVHSLLTLGVDLPRHAAALGIPCVMTLHDYSLVCPSGGTRVHLRERHVCDAIDVERCARCFPQSAVHLQMVTARRAPAAVGAVLAPIARTVGRHAPDLLARARAAAARFGIEPGAGDIAARLDHVRSALAAVHTVVAPSSFIAEEFARLGVISAPIEVADNGHAGFVPRRSQPAGGSMRVGFVGTLSWEKGVHVLIAALRLLRPGGFSAHIFGGFSVAPDYVASLRREAHGLPVVFEGGFAPDQVADVFSRIDVLVVPSLWLENSPLVVHEAFLAGVPVVASRRGGLPGLLGESQQHLTYRADSAEQLAAILQSLIDHPSQRAAAAAALPPVRSIERDASDWDGRYARAIAAAPVGSRLTRAAN
jgi:glycosyltransferase involved in cell wall biosynthesis